MTWGESFGDRERRKFDAKDGSTRLLARICQYHANHAKTGLERDYWRKLGLESSFGS